MTNPLKVVVVVEITERRPIGLVYEMLALAHRLVTRSGGWIEACALGDGLDGVGEDLIAHGADHVSVIDAPFFANYQADAWLPDISVMVAERRPDAVMLGHTPLGADLAPRLAFRLGTAVVTGCNNVSVTEGRLQLTRPCYGGKAEEVVSLVTSPVVFTLRAKCFEAMPAQRHRIGDVYRPKSVLDPQSVRTRIRAVRRDAGEANRLENARIIVAGGGGMKGPRGFQLATRLAELLGGAVGASRVACDMGWCPVSSQIGLSGKTVAPELYVAVGISGAGQHMAGCANAKNIVAVNTDPDAAIFRYARFGVVGDCHEVLPHLIDKLEARFDLTADGPPE